MLGRLIQTAATYGRGTNTLESATEESHTRNLLYGQSHHTYTLAHSPPTSPYTTPVFRPGSFDDRGGLELEEKDVRILIAQDAFGIEEKPTLLFDSRPNPPPAHPATTSHVRHASMTGSRAPLPNDWKPQVQHAASIPSDNPFRTRGPTVAANTAPWTRSIRDTGTREEAFLECMFGVTSSTKTATTTKMHILPGKLKSTPKLDSRGKNGGGDGADPQPRRTPLQRSRTSNTLVRSQTSPQALFGPDADALSQDSILVTRLFSVTLSETVAPSVRLAEGSIPPAIDSVAEETVALASPGTQAQQAKKPKLVERKVPAFAIGLVINLPRQAESYSGSSQSRPISRSAHAHTLSSASSSYGSDMQNSWAFLNAIPESLASTTSSIEEPDKRIETVVSNEDVILRAIASLEIDSAKIIHEQLQKILDQVVGPTPKTPKEKSMQRINQRIISITDVTPVAKSQSLQEAARHVMRRIVYAFRIPRVVVGLGFGGGHWSDEARTAFRVCGRRQQNFFLFTLITAFLGQHTDWLQRLAPEWYRAQYRTQSKQHSEPHTLLKRTVIISDQRAVARRLIFLLASFLPGVQGLDGLQKPGDDLLSPQFSMSSPSSQIIRNESLRRTANRRVRENRLHSNSHERSVLATSADSMDSIMMADRSRRLLVRKDSDAVSIKGSIVIPSTEVESIRKGLTATSALTSHPATPVAVFSTQRSADAESYFPPFSDNNESMATTGLTNLLRRSSSSLGNSSNMSSRWGSLVSGLSEIWGTRQHNSGDSGSVTAYSPEIGSTERRSIEINQRRKTRNLQEMVNQVERSTPIPHKSSETRAAERKLSFQDAFSSPTKQIASAPRLRVDNKDGVIDVDLDLPGFSRIDTDELFKSPSKSTNRSLATSLHEAAESVRSLRPASATFSSSPAAAETRVAGYLRRHHEDFSVYAVRPYAELEDDIKRTMVAEPSSISSSYDVSSQLNDEWFPVCSTVIADMRTFSIRKLTLKQKVRISQSPPQTSSPSTPSVTTSQRLNRNSMERTFVEEEIKDFDTALADAIEKVLDLGETMQTPAVSSPRIGHSRSISSSTMRSTLPSMSAPGASSYTGMPRELVRQDCRSVVLGALEDVVKDICDDLNKLEKGRDIHGTRSFDASDIKEEMRQENVLREGVKCWLLNLEQSKVY